MLTDLKVKVGPQFYRYHEGAFSFGAVTFQGISRPTNFGGAWHRIL